MGQLKITDLVDEKAMADLRALNAELQDAKLKFSEAAKELAKGLKIKIDGLEDMEKVDAIINHSTKQANEATEQMNETAKKQKKIINETTNSISRKLSAIEKENAKKREAVKVDVKVLEAAEKLLGSREKNIKKLAELEKSLKDNRKAQNDLAKSESEGKMTAEEAMDARVKLIAQERDLKDAKRETQKTLAIEEKMSNSVVGSYTNLSQKLELLKRAYKQMGEETKESAVGKQMADEITNLDNALKDSSASMGEFQRNVGNYAIGLNSQLCEILGVSDQVGNSLIKLAQDGSVGFDTLKVKATSFFKTLGVFLANPAILAILGLGATSVAFKWVYDYNKGLQKATKLTHDFTKAVGADLTVQRNEVQALADMYEKDFQETLISTNALAKQFGISFHEAFDYISQGFSAGADANGEFLDNVKEYPAYFKEAGISASQFIAIVAQSNQMGIYSDKGIDVIKEGNIRIREMTQATKDALEGIGISSKKVMEELANGEKTTFDIMQEVSAKLSEFPESASAVGTALADIFGGPGEDAGLQYIKTLKDIETDLDTVVEKAGVLAKLQKEQLNAYIEMENALSGLFDFTGGSFEAMTAKMKIFFAEGITKLIRGVADLANTFIEVYNNTEVVRMAWLHTVAAFKSGMDFVFNLFHMFKEILVATGMTLQGAFTLDWDKFKDGLEKFGTGLRDMAVQQWKDMEQNAQEARDSLDKKLKPIVIPVRTESDKGDKKNGGGGSGTKGKTEKELEEEAKQRKKIIIALKESEIAIMDEGFKKEIAKMRENHRKRLSEITGHSDEENKLRRNLTTKYMIDLANYTKAYRETYAKADISNQLEYVEEGSEKELELRSQLLDMEREAELKMAERIGADKEVIYLKYEKRLKQVREEVAAKRVSEIEDQYAAEGVAEDIAYTQNLAELTKRYAEGVITKEEFERKKAKLTEKYALLTTQNSIDMLEEQLKVEDLSTEDREKLELELAKAKANIEKQMADNMISETERQDEADRRLSESRIKNAKRALDITSQALDAINGLGNAQFEGKLQKLDEESEANQEYYDNEIARIEELEEQGAISSEEAEARKRAAEAKTQAEEERLDRKRKEIQYKQAVWNKANQLAQTGIATARAIMEAMPNVVLAAIVGAMGAIQAATIMATPIPKYAKGTDNHPGGLAVVGDGGKQEIVMFDGKAFLTDNKPTLVDLPRGAEVIPDASMAQDINRLQYVQLKDGGTSFVLDYNELAKGHKETARLLRMVIKSQGRIYHRQDYNNFKKLVL